MQRPSTFLITNEQNVSYLVATTIKSYIQTSEMDIIQGFLRRLPSSNWAKKNSIYYTKNMIKHLYSLYEKIMWYLVYYETLMVVEQGLMYKFSKVRK